MSDTTSNMPLRLAWLSPEELDAHPENWKSHPAQQITALEALIGEVGWAGALLYNERTERLLDGHARKQLGEGSLVDGKAPVLVGAWSDDEERLILRMLDPIGWMAEQNEKALQEMSEKLQAQTEELQAVLEEMVQDMPTLPELPGADSEYEIPEEEASVNVTVATYRFSVSRETYQSWVESIWQSDVGFDDASVIAEIRRRLEL